MAESCSLTCNVRDSQGNIIVSKLWKSLDKYFKGNRRDALAHYFLTKDAEFLENNRELSFDTEGEVTFESLKKALDRDGEYHELTDNKVLHRLNEELKEELKSSKPDYTEALDNVLRFNKNNPLQKSFMATLKRNRDGSYMVEVVKRTSDAEYELAEHVKNRIITDALMQVLRERGLDVDFEDNPTFAIKYSTMSIPVYDSLYSIAAVLNGENTSKEVAEVAGHFIVSAMKSDPLIQRLINALTPEVQEQLAKDPESPLHRDDFIISNNSAEEAAGILIGRQLIAPFNRIPSPAIRTIVETAKGENKVGKAIHVTGKVLSYATGLRFIGKLLSRIANTVKKKLGWATEINYGKVAKDAEKMAATAAQGFISNPDMLDVTEGLTDSKVVTSGSLTKKLSDTTRDRIKAFNNMLGDLKSLVGDLSSIAMRSNGQINDMYENLKEIIAGTKEEFSPQVGMSSFADDAAITGMVYMLQHITSVLDTDIRSLLDTIQPSNRVDMYNNLARNGKNMNAVNVAVKKIGQIYMLMQTEADKLGTSEGVMAETSAGETISGTLKEAVHKLGEVLVGDFQDESGETVLGGLMGVMESKRRQVFVDAVKNLWGEEFVDVRAGILWGSYGMIRLPRLIDTSRTNTLKRVEDFVDSLNHDTSVFDRYLKSAADAEDFITGVGYRATRYANMTADRVGALFWDKIDELEMQMLDLFGTTDARAFYETYENEESQREMTGNLISEVNRGAWEKKRHEFKKQLKKEFNDYLKDFIQQKYDEELPNNPNFVLSLSDFEKGVLYHDFVDSKWEEWHANNSVENVDSEGNTYYTPDPEIYASDQWVEMFGEEGNRSTQQEKKLQWYKALIELKGTMDSLLPEHATHLYRAPQIQGRYSHRYRNIKAQYGSSTYAAVRALRRKFINWAVPKTTEAYQFGTDNEFNELQEDPLENVMYYEKEKLDRLPIYGVNKLKNMEELSTDLFGTLLNYGHMAASYNSMEKLVDIFEIGVDVLKNRKIAGTVDPKKTPRSLGRYVKFLENNVYSIHVNGKNWDKRGIIRKLAGSMTSLATKLFLGGNVPGGMVNLGTGMVEILKEAAAGENFDMKDLWDAHGEYFKDVIDQWSDNMFTNTLFNPQRPTNKNSLWIRYWNIRSENQRFYRGQRFDAKALSLLDNRLFEWYGHSIMLPYSCGDHYMQTIPYYAMGKHEKVYDHDGNMISLMDAYEIVEGKEVKKVVTEEEAEDGYEGGVLGNTHRRLALRHEIFKSIEDIEKYDTAKEMLGKVRDLFENNPKLKKRTSISLDLFSEEEKSFLRSEDMPVPTTVGELEGIQQALEGKVSELLYGEDDEAEFMDKCRNICNRLHGIYNVEDRVAFQQLFYGNMLMAMRGYALGMVNRRYAPSSFNVVQRKVVEGSTNTLLKVLAMPFVGMNSKNCKDVLSTFVKTVLLVSPLSGHALFLLPKFSEGLKADMLRAKFTEHQFYNIRRAAGDYLTIWSLMLLRALASPGKHFGLAGEPDEDDVDSNDVDNKFWGFMFYMVNRLYREQAAFNLPSGMWYEATQLLDYVPTGLSGMMACYEVGSLFIKTEWDKLTHDNPSTGNSELYYQRDKEGKYEEGDRKDFARLKRYIPYYKSYYTFTHGYDSAASYEYGRRIRGH